MSATTKSLLLGTMIRIDGYYGSVWNSWSWPESDVVWFSVVALSDLDEFEIQATWEVAESHRVSMK